MEIEKIKLKIQQEKEEGKQRLIEYWQTLVINDWNDIPHLPNPIEEYQYQILYQNGILRKEDLIDGQYYEGKCRNVSVALWDKKENCFWYIREKFGTRFPEKINHLQDDDGYDLFVPWKLVEPTENKKVVF